MTEATRIHPETGAILRRGVRPQTISYAIYSRTIDVPGWYPDDGGDSIHSGDDLAEIDRATRAMRADYAARIRSIRRSLRLSQEAAGRILGGGKRAFQKYEAGKTPPSEAAIGLIELVGRHPESLGILKQLPGRAA